MLEIVAGIGDDGQRSRRQNAVEAERQLGAADPARQRQHAHRKRSCSAGRIKAAAGTSGADQREPADQHHRHGFVGLAHQQPRGGGDLVGKAGLGHQQFAPEEIGMAAHIDQRRQPRGAQRDADRALAPRPAKAVADDDGDIASPKAPASCCRKRARRAVRVFRQQQHPLAAALRSAGSNDRCRHWPSQSRGGARRSAGPGDGARPVSTRTAPPRQSAGPCRPRRRARSLVPRARLSPRRHSAPRPLRRSSAPRPAHRRPPAPARSLRRRRRRSRRDRPPARPA